jgi:large subunit ribosomal protein L10
LSANFENKKVKVEEIKDKLSKAKSAVFVSFNGTDVAKDTALRASVRNANGEYKVYKNTLLLRALTELGYTGVEEYLHGTTSVAISYDDEIAPAKAIGDAKKDNDKLSVKFGLLDGSVIDSEYVDRLSSIPSRDTLLSKLAFLLKAPMQKLAVGLKAVADKE